MAITIGSLTFLAGDAPPIGHTAETLEEVVRPGIDGEGFRLAGERAQPVAWRTVKDFASAANAQTALGTYEAVVGTQVTVVDGAANTWTNVAVEAVRALSIRRVATPAGGQGATYVWLLAAQWTLRATD